MTSIEKLVNLLNSLQTQQAIILLYVIQSRQCMKTCQVGKVLGADGLRLAFRLKRLGLLSYDQSQNCFAIRPRALPLADKLINYYDLDLEMEAYERKLDTF